MAITREEGSASFTFIHRYIMQAIRDDLTPTRHDITDLLDELCETDDDGNTVFVLQLPNSKEDMNKWCIIWANRKR